MVQKHYLENNINSLKCEIRQGNNIGLKIIELIENNGNVETIHELAESIIGKHLSSYTLSILPNDADIVFISLVLIATLEYNGNFYDQVRTTYHKLYKKYSEQKIEGIIRSTIKKYDKKHQNSGRIINNVLTNSLVPKNYLSAFFEFIFDIYKVNFNYTISDSIYADFEFVYDGLRDNMLSQNDGIDVSVTQKTYKLIKSTKDVIATPETLPSIIALSIMIVKIIDQEIWQQPIHITNPYLKYGYEQWIQKIKNSNAKMTFNGQNNRFKSMWKPKFILDENNIFLITPTHKIKSKYDYKTICIEISNGNNSLCLNRHPKIKEIIGGYQIDTNKIKIDCPIGSLRYRVFSGGDIIYDSKEELCRDYIVFSEKGSELGNYTDYSGTAVFCHAEKEPNIKLFFENEHYKLSYKNVNTSDIVLLSKKLAFSFSSITEPDIIGNKLTTCFVASSESEELIPVFDSINYIMFESSNEAKNFEININGAPYPYNKFEYNLVHINEKDQYTLKIPDLKSGVYTFKVFKLGKGHKEQLLCQTIVLDKNLNYKQMRIDDKNYHFEIESSLFEKKYETINLDLFNEKWLSFNFDGKIYYYILPINFEMYKLSDNNWHSFADYIWIDDLLKNPKIKIYSNDFEYLSICSPSGQNLSGQLKLENKGYYKQRTLDFLMSFKSEYDYVILFFSDKNGEKSNRIFCINKCFINPQETQINFDSINKRLTIKCAYYGKGNVFIDVKDQRDNSIYKSDYLHSGQDVEITNLNSFENYTIEILEKAKGLSLNKNRELKRFVKRFYAWEDFIGKFFKVKEVYFDRLLRGEFVRMNRRLKGTYVEFVSRTDCDKFVGKIYQQMGNQKCECDVLNPVEIEICSDVSNNEGEIFITKDGDGLLYDSRKNTVMSTLDNKKATDIFYYVIKVE